ncbi:MAG: hypothetical protein LBG60_04915 [Bifidobacteriaceae bacterium]|nr:hypothetical protein [Bifidobacteriaceae bacterium]
MRLTWRQDGGPKTTITNVSFQRRRNDEPGWFDAEVALLVVGNRADDGALVCVLCDDLQSARSAVEDLTGAGEVFADEAIGFVVGQLNDEKLIDPFGFIEEPYSLSVDGDDDNLFFIQIMPIWPLQDSDGGTHGQA